MSEKVGSDVRKSRVMPAGHVGSDVRKSRFGLGSGFLGRRRVLGEKKCGPVHKIEKIELKSRDACVVGVYFLFSDEPTSSSLHREEKTNINASNYCLLWGICIHIPPLYMP